MIKNILLFFLLMFSSAFSYINIYPTNFNKKVDGQGGLIEYNLYNRTDKNVRYHISLLDSKEDSMASWGEIYPKTLTLKPGEEKVIKLLIKAPKGTKEGEYSAVLNIKEMEVPNLKKVNSKNTSVTILTNFSLEILGYVGNISPKLEINDFNLKKSKKSLEFSGVMKNIGSRSGRYNMFLADSKGNNKYFLGDFTILKNESIQLSEFNQDIKDEKTLKLLPKLNRIFIEDKDDEKVTNKLSI